MVNTLQSEYQVDLSHIHDVKSMFSYSMVSSLLDRSKRFTLNLPGRRVHSDTNTTSLESIPPRCNYWAKTIHLNLLQVLNLYIWSENVQSQVFYVVVK